jgi:hypothetical protein
MHFLLHRDIRQNATVRWLLLGYLFCILTYLILLPFLESAQTGLSPAEIRVQVLGSEAQYIEPRSFFDLVTAIHIKLFLHSVIGLVLASLISRAHLRQSVSILLVSLIFFLPVLEAFSLVAVSVWAWWWAYLKAASFVAVWIIQFGSAAYSIFFLMGKNR